MHDKYKILLKSNGMGRTGIGLILLVLLPALAAPLLSPYLPGEYSGSIFASPSGSYWLGTNDVGQDIWTRLLYGARTSLLIGGGVALLATLTALVVGGSAALCGGLYDQVVMRVVDALLVLPAVLIAILASAYLAPGISLLIILLASLIWPQAARIFRARILSLKEEGYISAARTFGASGTYLMVRHILPLLGPLLSAVIVQHGRRAIFMEAGLSFLGVSDPTLISWGSMLQHALGYTYLDVWKWWMLPTGLLLSLTITGLALLGSALETISDPRLRSTGNR